jgi:hypothetical protein
LFTACHKLFRSTFTARLVLGGVASPDVANRPQPLLTAYPRLPIVSQPYRHKPKTWIKYIFLTAYWQRTGCTRGMLRFAASVVDLCDTRNEPLRVLLFGSCWRLFSKSQYQFLGMDQTTAWHVVLPPTKPGVLHSLHRSWEDAHLINYHLAGPDLRYFSRCSILLSSVARSAHVHAQQAVLRTTLAACLLGNTSISTKL